MEYGVVWSMEHGVCSMHNGVRIKDYRVWSMECGVWRMKHGVQSMASGVWSAA